MSPFWPVVASRTSSTSSTSACRSTTRLTLPSSSIRPVLVCSRPAVSSSTASALSSAPCLTASNATLAGSAPSGPRTTVAPARSPQVTSCSAAAARKVSAAPSTTCRPPTTSTRASLPVVVVLPVPFTPTTSTTAGRPPCGGAHGASGHLGAQRLDQLDGHLRAEIGLQEHGLDVLPRLLVQLTGAEQAEQTLAEAGAGAGEPAT